LAQPGARANAHSRPALTIERSHNHNNHNRKKKIMATDKIPTSPKRRKIIVTEFLSLDGVMEAPENGCSSNRSPNNIYFPSLGD
jgi:hypothetical protein